jgi:hypothetical protein
MKKRCSEELEPGERCITGMARAAREALAPPRAGKKARDKLSSECFDRKSLDVPPAHP